MLPSIHTAVHTHLQLQELEEEDSGTVYDDYKFITKSELEDLGLEHLIGPALVRLLLRPHALKSQSHHDIIPLLLYLRSVARLHARLLHRHEAVPPRAVADQAVRV